MRPKADTLFEISWDVCNKTTNIHEILKSKAATLQKTYENYFLVGPYTKENHNFIEEKTPKSFRDIFMTLQTEGINCRYGKWNIKEEPKVILVEPDLWPESSSRLIEEYQKKNNKTVAHFHNKSPKETKYPSVLTIYNNQKTVGNKNQIITTTSKTHSKKILQETDNILHLGINNNTFPEGETLSELHKISSNKLKEVISFYFFPYYRFNLNESITILVNLEESPETIIKSLSLLENRLQKENSNKTIIALLYNPEDNLGIKEIIAENKNKYSLLKRSIENKSQEIIKEIIKNTIEEKENLLDTKTIHEINKLKKETKCEGIPPVSAQKLRDESNNRIIKLLKEYNLCNSKETKVKTILFSSKLNGADGIINLNEEDLISGLDMGIFMQENFNSLKCAALGTPCITSNENSLGDFLISQNKGEKGIIAIKDSPEISQTISRCLYNFTLLNKKAVNLERIESKKISKLVDWENIIHHYIDAHNKAFEK